MTDIRIVPCEMCGGNGGWSVERTFDPFTGRIGYEDVVCDGCNGTGSQEIEVEPVDLEDLE